MASQSFLLPDLGEGLSEAIIREWHCQPGDAIQAGEVIAVVETAKALIELPSPFSGTLEKLTAELNQPIAVGHPICSLRTSNQATVVGELESEQSELPPTTPATPLTQDTTDLDQQLPPHLQAMAKQLNQRGQTVPSTLHAVIPLASTHQLTARLLLALPNALRAAPALHGHYIANQRYQLATACHIGLVVQTEEALTLPVINHVESLDLPSCQEKIRQLKENPQQPGHSPTFIVSNFGTFAGRFGTPLLYPPCIATLGVGQAYWENNQQVLPLSITLDHRVATGADAGKLIQALAIALAAPCVAASAGVPALADT